MTDKIPDSFKNVEEEVSFWESHSLSELLDETEEADHVFVKPEKRVLSFRFDRDLVDVLRKTSQKMGISQSALVQMLLKRSLSDLSKKRGLL